MEKLEAVDINGELKDCLQKSVGKGYGEDEVAFNTGLLIRF